MKYFIISSIIVFSFLGRSNHVLAQLPIPNPNFNFDSLVKVSNSYQKQDEVKLKMLNLLAYGYPGVDPAKGIKTGEAAIALALKLNKPLLLAEAYNNTGVNHAMRGEFSIAMELYEKSLVINNREHNTFGSATNTLQQGFVYYNKKDYNKARELLTQALSLFEAITNKDGMARCYHAMGAINQMNNPTKALEYYQKALDLYEQLANKRRVAITLSGIGKVYLNLSDYRRALEYYQKSLVYYEQLGDKNYIATNLTNIGNVHFSLSEYSQALEYFKRALVLQEQLGNRAGMAAVMSSIGLIYNSLSDYPKALEYHQKSLAIDEQLDDKDGIATNYNNIANVYSALSNYNKALEYRKKALTFSELVGNKHSIANTLSNIGNNYKAISDYPKALECYKNALSIYTQLGNKNGEAINMGNIGLIYLILNNYTSALEYLENAFIICDNLGDKKSTAFFLIHIGKLYTEAPDSVLHKAGILPLDRYNKALEMQQKSITLAKDIGDVFLQKEAFLNISITYEKQVDYIKAYDAYKNYIILRDSIANSEVQKKINRREIQFEFEKKETELKYQNQLSDEKLQRQMLLTMQQEQELDIREQALVISNKEKDLQRLAYLKERAEKQKKDQQLTISVKEKDLQKAQLKTQKQALETKNAQRNLFIAGTFLMLLLAASIFVGLKRTQKEKKRSDDLLLNILPEEVAEELKSKGSADAKQFDEVTVLFTDFKDFTQISEKMTPTELVNELNTFFKAFDEIIGKLNIEKIKTIGDSYMCVGGLPTASPHHAEKVVNAGLAIQSFVAKHSELRKSMGKEPLQIRIGIHSGPVVAGIVGIKKYAYDIWGDTVNTASRMESSGEAGKVNISDATYSLIKDKFKCTPRGKIIAKHKGEMEMYFVEGRI